MRPSKLYEALHTLIGERVPLAAALGGHKSLAQVASDLDYDFLDVRAVQLDPVDLPRSAADRRRPDRMGPTEVSPHHWTGHPVSR
jgi:hypothetical protein